MYLHVFHLLTHLSFLSLPPSPYLPAVGKASEQVPCLQKEGGEKSTPIFLLTGSWPCSPIYNEEEQCFLGTHTELLVSEDKGKEEKGDVLQTTFSCSFGVL